MDNGEKMKYLQQYKNLDRHINRLLEEKDRWRSRAEKITPTISDMPHGGDGENQRELAICKMIDCEREATIKIDEYVDLGREITAAIDEMENDDYRLLLQYRYIDCLTWEQIAVAMNYTFQWIYKLHWRALEKFCVPVDCN